ncbi:uncharacterized protein LOC111366584 isoform X2 [Olea europaea var. sylvestris]|nr:uncharacterized protein LOC111366584 isoform X2 [Olea europaea var. sylvestris]
MIADIDLMDVCLILLGASASVNILSGDKKEGHDCNADTYVEKEKLVLVKFQDFLNRIIVNGNIKAKWSTSHGSGSSRV